MSSLVRKQRRHTCHSEEGFVLLWAAMLALPLLTIGFIFLGYAQANLTKLRAQYHTMNLVTIGSFSSEFDSGETLNSMAALASALGFTGVRPDSSFQNTDGGRIHFLHETDDAAHTVSALLFFDQDPITEIVSQLGSIQVGGMSSAKPGAYLISLVLDFSQSLNRDFNADDLLQAYDVIQPNGAPGSNGVVDSFGRVMPDDATLLALPYSFDITNRIRLPYFDTGAQWPWPTSNSVACTPTNETGCGGRRPPMINDLRREMSSNFLAYKKAAVILTGVAAQATPYLTVDLLGGLLPDERVAFNNYAMVGEPDASGEYDSPYLPMDNDGVYEIWDYHFPSVESYEEGIEPPGPKVVTNVFEEHSFDNPKDPFRHDINIDFRFPTFGFMHAMGFRKLAKYASFSDTDGKVHSPGTFSAFLDPPLPVLENEKFNPPPEDSFVWHIGEIGGILWATEDWFYPFGYGTVPLVFSVQGPAHPPNDHLHRPIGDGITYPCEVGPPAANNAQWSSDKSTTGYALCLIRDYCDDFSMNKSVDCDDPNIAAHPDSKMHYLDSEGEWPRCGDAGHVPKCESGGGLVEESAVFCTFGDGAGHMVPRCTQGGIARCYNESSGSFTPGGFPACRQFTDSSGNAAPPLGHGNCREGTPCRSALTSKAGGYQPQSLGTVRFATDAPEVGSNLFYYINDMGVLPAGTFTHNAVPNNQCETFLAETSGEGRCAMILVTDGRPHSIDFAGNTIDSDSAVMVAMQENIDNFTQLLGGKSFVWFLGSVNQWQAVIEAVQEIADDGLLSELQQDAFEQVQSGTRICEDPEASAAWNSIEIWAKCPSIDQLTTIYLSEQSMQQQFKALMDNPVQGRHWVETSVSNSASGPTLDGSLGSFLGGLKNVIGLMKQETKFHQ